MKKFFLIMTLAFTIPFLAANNPQPTEQATQDLTKLAVKTTLDVMKIARLAADGIIKDVILKTTIMVGCTSAITNLNGNFWAEVGKGLTSGLIAGSLVGYWFKRKIDADFDAIEKKTLAGINTVSNLPKV